MNIPKTQQCGQLGSTRNSHLGAWITRHENYTVPSHKLPHVETFISHSTKASPNVDLNKRLASRELAFPQMKSSPKPPVVLMKFLPQGCWTSSRQLELAMRMVGAATSAIYATYIMYVYVCILVSPYNFTTVLYSGTVHSNLKLIAWSNCNAKYQIVTQICFKTFSKPRSLSFFRIAPTELDVYQPSMMSDFSSW